jgi:IclR family transcriptional regulator, KDG regulon repressor
MREIQSLARGLRIVDYIVNADRPVTVTELATLLEVDKSTASRLVQTLQNYGYLQQDTNSRAYVVGKRLHTVGWQITNRYDLRETARPFLDQLAEATGECAHIGVYSAGKVVVTDDVQPDTSLLRVVGKTGRGIYLHNTAVGKGLLAHGDFPLPDDLPAVTDATITDPDALRRDLARVKACGYALDDEENEIGVRCIAAPVFDAVGSTIAAIGVSGPKVRISDDQIEVLGKAVCEAARRLSRELGYFAVTV